MESLSITKEALAKNRQNLEDLLKRRFYIMQSFGIYGGKAGLYDYGPPGSAIKANVEQLWREHFIIEDDILEINCTNVTPEEVLIASGHVEKFADVMVKDAKDGTICYRADHLIEEHVSGLLEKDEKAKKMKPEQKEELQKILKDLPNYKKEDMGKVITNLKIKSPKTGNELKEPYEFNLMFEIDIGPTGDSKGYLRPETAQGMFVNFKNLLEYNGGKVPFGCAQIGLGFRNEIAPRSGLLRVREFALAEIEYFVDPKDKSYPKFKYYKDHKMTLLTKQAQASDGALKTMTLSEAVDNGTINNETLAYFMARTHIFLQRVGIKDEGVRFRQHREDEKAHYSSDCWDAEVLTSYGWVEMVGIADRSAYDLTRHSQFSKKELVASRPLKQAKTLNYIEMNLNKPLIGKTFKTNNKAIVETLESMDDECKGAGMAKINAKEAWKITVAGAEFEITPEMVTLEPKSKNVMEEKFTPNVIEPAFGIGRIIYAAWEHNFKMRSQERTYINLPPKVAPYKCSILTVIQDEAYDPIIHEIATKLKKLGVSHKVDASGSSIGKRYARTDEVGVPFAVTIDNDTLKNADVTLREIVTCDQVRIPVSDVSNVIHALSEDQLKWSDVTHKYPKFILKSED